jgi:hypothetical protein
MGGQGWERRAGEQRGWPGPAGCSYLSKARTSQPSSIALL